MKFGLVVMRGERITSPSFSPCWCKWVSEWVPLFTWVSMQIQFPSQSIQVPIRYLRINTYKTLYAARTSREYITKTSSYPYIVHNPMQMTWTNGARLKGFIVLFRAAYVCPLPSLTISLQRTPNKQNPWKISIGSKPVALTHPPPHLFLDTST